VSVEHVQAPDLRVRSIGFELAARAHSGIATSRGACFPIGSIKRRSAYGYMRTSPSTNIGADKDSEHRHRHAIESYARTHGYELVDWYYDAAVRGARSPTECLICPEAICDGG
jgi:hypothetical protein